MHVRFSVLSLDEQETIHRAALELLERIGMRIHSDALLDILTRAGAQPGAKIGSLRFPAGMIIDALAAAPKQWDMVNVLGERVSLGTQEPHFVVRLLLPQVLDYGSSAPRLPLQQDIVNLCRLGESLPRAAFALKTDCACSDLPAELNYLETIATVYRHSTRIVLANPIHPLAARYWVELGEAATGRPMEEYPIVRCGIPVNSPFQIDADSAESLIYLARKGAPISCMTMPIAGVSAPMTLAGVIAQHTAEVLGLIAAVQAARPGARVCFAGTPCTNDMATGAIVMASPATSLFNNALTAMAHYYHLPSHAGATYTDASRPDIQCGVEKSLSVFFRAAAGADIAMMGGDIQDAKVISYEQLLIDYDIWETVCRLMRGVSVTADTLALEAIERVGLDGQFVTDSHTIAHLRGEDHFFGGLWSRGDSHHAMLERAHARVEDILARVPASRVPSAAVERIEDYVEAERSRIRART